MSLSPTLALACELIRRPSVTPVDADCQQLMMQRLAACGFDLEPMRIEEVDNFWARRAGRDGGEGPVLCFAGHTDVVPTGPAQAWQHQPFDALIDADGMLCGRGAADMKGSLAAMIIATERFVAEHPDHRGSIAYLTGGNSRYPKETLDATGAGRTARLDNFRSMEVWAGRRRSTARARGGQDKGQRTEMERFVEAVRTGGPMPVGLDSLVATTSATVAVGVSLLTGRPERV